MCIRDRINTDTEPANSPVSARPQVPTKIIAKDGSRASTTFIFDGFEVFIDNFLVYDENNKEFNGQADTVATAIELAHDLTGKIIEIKSTLVKNIQVQLAYETSIAVSNEGEHCDLNEPLFATPRLPHYKSEFYTAEKISEMKFQLRDFSEEEKTRYPDISLQQMKELVGKHCEKYYLSHIEKANSIRAYPYYIGISRYYLIISGAYQDTGQRFNKLIVFERPLGD